MISKISKFFTGERDPELKKFQERWYDRGGNPSDSVFKVVNDVMDRLDRLEEKDKL